MSRAFVKEQDGPEPTPRTAPALPPGVPNHITPAGAAAWEARLAAARAARSARGDVGQGLDDEVRWLEARVAGFVVTAPPPRPERVSFGCRVEVEGARGRRAWRLVGVDETDGASAISWLSPVARALIGARVGDEVVLRTPAGEETVEVLSVSAGS